ncbi:MAG: hypothetical protein JRD68_16205 [Deltaproteobacteria bacterium]|nr:hypothetical protein [Deltaproteobacteria bacterium]
MRQILIDELIADDVAAVHEFLETNAVESGVEGLYWVELTEDLLDPGQFEQKKDHPFCFAVEVGDSWVKFELLIRSRHNMKSTETRFASRIQLEFVLEYSNRIIEEKGLKT